MGMRRVFIAADISDELRRRAAAHIGDLRSRYPQKGISWVRAENLHLTLRFLGETPDERLTKIENDITREVENF